MEQNCISSWYIKVVTVVFSCLIFLFDKVTGSNLCPDTDNVYCDGYDEYCCGSSCCLYDWHYDYGFWNIWYFWFIIFFIFMSCCGGCGFYRRRQVYLRQHQATSLTQGVPGNTMLSPGHTTYASTEGHTLVAHPVMYPQAPPLQEYFPGPPSYTEVTSKPDMYPKAYPDSQSTGIPAPTSPGLPFPVSPQMTMPPHTDYYAPPNTPPPHNGISPPPYTPTPQSVVPPSTTSSNTAPPAPQQAT